MRRRNIVAPTAKTSARSSMSRPRACSGGMYGVVPRVVPSFVKRPSLEADLVHAGQAEVEHLEPPLGA